MANSNQFTGEILHFNAVRLRVVGSGNLKQYLRSLDDVHFKQLTDVTLQSVTNRELVTLANFIDQRAQYEGIITGFEETFSVSKITIFIKPVATGYPQ